MEIIILVAGQKTNPDAVLFLYLTMIARALMLAGLLWLLQFCFTNTPGFIGYYKKLQAVFKNEARPQWQREIVKPLGLCIYCQSVWAAGVLFVYLYGFDLVNMLLFIGATYFFVEYMARIIHPPKSEI